MICGEWGSISDRRDTLQDQFARFNVCKGWWNKYFKLGSHRACDKLYFNGTQRYLKPAPSEISNFRDAYQPNGRRYESFSGTFSTTDDITSFLLSDSVIEADGGAALRQTEYQTPGKTTGIPPSSQYS